MGKFFNGKVRKNRDTMIKTIIIGVIVAVIVLMIILIVATNRSRKGTTVYLNDSIDVQINTESIDKYSFFSEKPSIKEDKIAVEYNKCDFTKLGTCSATVTVDGTTSKDVTINIVDTESPIIKLKDVTINYGESYNVNDFVESCSDNTKEDCIISYYMLTKDEDGNTVDYSKYTEVGTYEIKITASDVNKNTTEVQTAKLTIKSTDNGETPVEPVKKDCKYGDITVNESQKEWPIALMIADTNDGCAVNRDLFDNESYLSELEEIKTKDIENLKKQLNSILVKYYNNTSTSINPIYENKPIYNETMQGIIGYAIHVRVYIVEYSNNQSTDIFNDNNLKLEYYLNSDYSRKYIADVYNIG